MFEFTLPWLGEMNLKVFLTAWSLSVPRILGMSLLLPVLGAQSFPGLLRTGISAGFALVIVPLVAKQLPQTGFDTLTLMGLCLKECLIGLMLGFLFSVPFWAMEALGFLIDNQCGATISATLNPFAGHDTSTLGALYAQAFVAFFVASGGLTLVMGLLYETYRLWPVESFVPRLSLSDAPVWLGILNGTMALALTLAAPAMLLMYLAELGLALISSFVPQLQVFFIAMPIKCALALFVLAVYGANLFSYINEDITGLRDALPRLARLMGAP
ncbi:EscT/YscT/HrcT family type III secretion system export apparatus protein [Pandoraea iniqua]|uniref:EscT/YscT/HrcT family type III secretion system export apparatus protein n=1 Tax=Pandoraea iniqua TaxID=2508288 RepID=A0A5E4YIP6_9BURK|nr:type III secretion system export apparatus subunit SctT [Pandoraea iniqua]VVE48158.1 EscT/YscT/HrcT family type III secretion system export apparatus protein [Pandoraea iniqua]